MWQHRSPAIGRRRSHDPSIPLTPTHRVQDHLLFVPLLHFVLQLVVFLAYAASPRLMSTTSSTDSPPGTFSPSAPRTTAASTTGFAFRVETLKPALYQGVLKSAVVFLFRLSYHLANGLFYLLLDCKVCFKSSHRHRYGKEYNFTRGSMDNIKDYLVSIYSAFDFFKIYYCTSWWIAIGLPRKILLKLNANKLGSMRAYI